MDNITSNQINRTTNQEDTNPMNPNETTQTPTTIPTSTTNEAPAEAQKATHFYVSSSELASRIQYPTRQRTDQPLSPADWWRRLCRIKGTRIFVSGDLPAGTADFERQLDHWRAAGITHIIDAREEWSDEKRVAELYPDMTYCWVGTHDDGSGQPDEWFRAGVDAALEALGDPAARIVIHCHMGVNRGPSMAFAVLLAMGWNPVAAAAAIREARPIAAILYAASAIDWFHRQGEVSASEAAQQRAELSEWFEQNDIDVAWVINRIRRAEW